MNRILLVEASTNGEKSVSRMAGNLLIEKLKTYGPVEILKHDLSVKDIPHVNGFTIGAFYTPEEKRADEQKSAVALSDQFVEEILNSDTVVITTPMWNFSIPSSLKAWIDHIVRVGKTFTFAGGTRKGHLAGKKVYVVISAGNIYSTDPSQTYEHLSGYFKVVFNFVGVTDVTVLWVEGTAVPTHKGTALDKFKEKLADL